MAFQTTDMMPNIQVEGKEKEESASNRGYQLSLSTLMSQEPCWLQRTLVNPIPFPAFGIEADEGKRRLGIAFKSPALQYHIKKFTHARGYSEIRKRNPCLNTALGYVDIQHQKKRSRLQFPTSSKKSDYPEENISLTPEFSSNVHTVGRK